MPSSLGQSGRLKPPGSEGTPPAGNGPGALQGPAVSSLSGQMTPAPWGKARQSVRTRAARVEPLCSSATCGSSHLLRPARLRADTPRSWRPRPLPQAGWNWGRAPPPSPQPSPSVTISHPRDELPPTAKVGWCIGKEVGEGELMIKESSPPTRPRAKVTWRFTWSLSPPRL